MKESEVPPTETCSSGERKWAYSEYHSVLSDEFSLDVLKQFTLSGGLRTSVLRSISWKILLKCLPLCKAEWSTVSSRTRDNYDSLKRCHIADPHNSVFTQDPQQNNPLTQAEQNPWHKFFADYDLRDLISKDVARTFPEMSFFQQEYVRSMMSDILLVYAKENPFLAYKQGMHEILAPLLFVLFSDIQAFDHAKENLEVDTISPNDLVLLSHVYDVKFLEHDAYTMFSEIMMEINKWYEDGESSPERSRHSSGPFLRVQDATPTSNIMRELTSIGDRLYSLDPTLASHLNGLDIPPQIYGIRWLRLLFGREFPIHDLLFLWDVLLCDRPIVRMVECVFIAMLVYIRELLLHSDYGGCLQYLMRYPPIVDISSFMQLVKHYRNPTKVARPASLGLSNFANITVTGSAHPNSRNEPDSLGFEEPPSGFRPKSRSMLEKVKGTLLDKPGSSPTSSQTRRNTGIKTKSPSERYPNCWEKELQTMENQVACLQSRLNEKDILCSEVAQRIEECSRELSTADTELARQNIAERLRQLSHSLTSEFVPQALSASKSERIELAKEVRAAKRPVRHIRNENEMVELKTSLMM